MLDRKKEKRYLSNTIALLFAVVCLATPSFAANSGYDDRAFEGQFSIALFDANNRPMKNYGGDVQGFRMVPDPEFGPKAADVVGLYLSPPENAVVLCVDEKPHIQVLERAKGWLRLPNGKALNGFSHCYQRHGTSTLFAALEVATGQVQVGHYPRRRRREFLDFMNDVVAGHPDKEVHVILDNLNTHKPKQDRWLRRHPNVHFHFIPTYSSWLNMVEIWFSILSRQELRNLSCLAVRQLRQAIDRFVKAYQETATPFEWTKWVVFPTALQRRYSDLCK